MTMRLRLIATAAALTALLTTSACGQVADLVSSDDASSGDPSSQSTQASEPTDPPTSTKVAQDLKAYYGQQIDWSSCNGSNQCAGVDVPIDYDDLSAGAVTLELQKIPATGADPVGTLLVNPGGPGGSGVDYAKTFADQAGASIRDNFDVVGFDPRGVGTSDPITCLDDSALDTFIAFDPDPDTEDEANTAVGLIEGMGSACEQNTGALAAHVSTIEVAKDLDILRDVVGDAKLNYYGASYGTYIGATYAELFPDTVGRMVLDGAIDPLLSPEELNIEQAAGFETALDAYVADCVANGSCPIEGDEAAVISGIQDFLGTLDAEPLDTSDPDRPLTEGLGFYGIAITLYNAQSWPALTQALQQALDGDGSTLLYFSDTYWGRQGGTYQDNSAQVIYAVNCLDHPTGEVSFSDIEASEAGYVQAAPTFGQVFAWSALGCAYWPIKATETPLTSYDAEGSAPIVVVGTTRDPATPYAWAKSLAGELSSGVFLSRDGDGHTGYSMGNACIDDAIDGYFARDQVPADGKQC